MGKGYVSVMLSSSSCRRTVQLSGKKGSPYSHGSIVEDLGTVLLPSSNSPPNFGEVSFVFASSQVTFEHYFK